MTPTDTPPTRARGRGRGGRGLSLPRGGRGARGRGVSSGLNTPTAETPTTAMSTAIMTPITPAAAFPELRIVPGSAQSFSSLGTPLSASTPMSGTPLNATPISGTPLSGTPVSGTATAGPSGPPRRARAGLRGAVGARRAVTAPRFRGRRTMEEREALAQAEKDRFGEEIAARERDAARGSGGKERGRGRGRGVRGRDSDRGRGNRESRWARGGRGGRDAFNNPTAPVVKTDAFAPSNPFRERDMNDIGEGGIGEMNFPAQSELSEESEDDGLGEWIDTGSNSFGAAGQVTDTGDKNRLLQPIRISRLDHDAANDADQFGLVATGLTAASRERPAPPPRKWKGVWQDSDDETSDDLNMSGPAPVADDSESDQEGEKQARQPVFRTQQHRDEYARLKRSRARLVSLLANMNMGSTTATKREDQPLPVDDSSAGKNKRVTFVDSSGDSTPVPPMIRVKPEPTDDDSEMIDVKPELDTADTLDGSEEPSAQEEDPRADRLFLFQFPPIMPRLLPRAEAQAERTAREVAKEELRVQSAAMAGTSSGPGDGTGDTENSGFPPPHAWFEPQLTSGKAGKLRVHKSGKVTLQIGGNKFLVHEGVEAGFLQTGMVVKLPKEKKEKKTAEGGEKKGVKKEGETDVMDLDDDDEDDGPDEDVGAYSMGPISGKLVSSVYWENTLGKESTLYL